MSFFNQLFGKGRSDNSSEFHTLVEQSYDHENFIPSRIVVKASGEQSIQKIIDVDRYM
jgi:hypothetical protein